MDDPSRILYKCGKCRTLPCSCVRNLELVEWYQKIELFPCEAPNCMALFLTIMELQNHSLELHEVPLTKIYS